MSNYRNASLYTQGGGTVSSSQFPVSPVTHDRSPTTNDIRGPNGMWPIGQNWINSSDGSVYELVAFSSLGGTVTATWTPLNTSGSSGILTINDVSGDIDRNINIVGEAGQINVTNDDATNTITLSLAGGSTAIDSIGVSASNPPGTNPVLPNTNGLIDFVGAQLPANTTSSVIQSQSNAASTVTIGIQRSSSAASSTIGLNGVCHFDSDDFTIDSNGFVNLLSVGVTRLVQVDEHTAPGTDPVAPAPGGIITVTGGQVASGTTSNVIQTNSLAANAYTVQIQRSATSVGSTVGLNGVCHFNAADFTIDSNGFVSAIGGGGGGGFVVLNVQTFTTSGTYTPTASMAYCLVQMVGGGGGGGGASIDGGDTAPSGSGGGGGLCAVQVFSAATIGASQTVTIGAGGTGGVGQADGTAGGTTSLGSLLTVSGGVQGQYMRASGPVQEGGDGGQAHTGTPDYFSFGGGGGYAINVGGAVVSGCGGSTLLSPGGKARAIAANGVSGGGYGGGGSGGVAATSVPANGGDGDSGVIIITEYIV